MGGLAQIEGEAEAGFAQIGRPEGARAGLPAVAEEVGAQGLPEVGCQGRSLSAGGWGDGQARPVYTTAARLAEEMRPRNVGSAGARPGDRLERKRTLRDAPISQEGMRQPLRRLYLLYHEVRAGESRYSYVVEKGMFERQVELFAQMREAESCGLWPELTFDDGHRSDVEIAAPILQARGLTARFFITAGWTGTKTGYYGLGGGAVAA